MEVWYHWHNILGLIFIQSNYIHIELWLSCHWEIVCKLFDIANICQSFSSEICKDCRLAHHWRLWDFITKVTSWGTKKQGHWFPVSAAAENEGGTWSLYTGRKMKMNFKTKIQIPARPGLSSRLTTRWKSSLNNVLFER